MKTPSRPSIPFAAIALSVVLSLPLLASADEGFWLFNAPPIKVVQQRYGFVLRPQWLDHLRLASTYLDGASAFVSPHGLVLSVHHGTPVLAELSTKDRDILKSGFYARTPEEELKCPDMELLVLQGIEDVSGKVLGAARTGMDEAGAAKVTRETISALEAAASEAPGTRGSVVSLYAGRVFHLYRYRVYPDVRLVFSPEDSVAFFGGDNDNFEFPRHCLDICLFRVWDNGRPLDTPDYLKWSPAGPKEGELVFISGTPSGTSQFLTLSQLEFLRDVSLPWDIAWRQGKRALIHAFGDRGPEEARLAAIRVWGLENGLKAARGYLSALKSTGIISARAKEEADLRQWVMRNPELAREVGPAWDRISEAQRSYSTFIASYAYFVNGLGFDTVYFRLARTVVRQALGEYPPDPRALELPQPCDDVLEVMTLTNSLQRLNEESGGMAEIQELLAGRTAGEAARELIAGTALRDPAAVRRLAASGPEGIRLSDDPMIKLALRFEPAAEALRSRYLKEYVEVEEKNSSLIMKARLKRDGAAVPPPDANGSLRLSYGVVKGLTDEAGRAVPFQTTYGGLYEKADRSGNKPPYELPARFLRKRASVDLKTGLNFVTTAESFGGNSGSPCVNTRGELVGLVFDSNFPGLANRFGCDGKRARSVLVDSKGILEALYKVYDAAALADELLGR